MISGSVNEGFAQGGRKRGSRNPAFTRLLPGKESAADLGIMPAEKAALHPRTLQIINEILIKSPVCDFFGLGDLL
jgi:hypothetical protein